MQTSNTIISEIINLTLLNDKRCKALFDIIQNDILGEGDYGFTISPYVANIKNTSTWLSPVTIDFTKYLNEQKQKEFAETENNKLQQMENEFYNENKNIKKNKNIIKNDELINNNYKIENNNKNIKLNKNKNNKEDEDLQTALLLSLQQEDDDADLQAILLQSVTDK